MKKGLGIGIVLLAVLAGLAQLRGEEVQWQAVSDVPHTNTPAVTLDRPIALHSCLPEPNQQPGEAVLRPLTGSAPTGAPSGLMPVSYETVIPDVVPPTPQPVLQVIATSAPVWAPPAPPTEEQEDQTDTLFAVDHAALTAAPSKASSKGIVRTSASVSVPGAAPGASEVPMVPGWDAPVDASWGTARRPDLCRML